MRRFRNRFPTGPSTAVAASALLPLLLGPVGCGGGRPVAEPPAPGQRGADASDSPPLVVYVVNYPLRYFAERIGGDEVEVVLPVPAGVDPVHWSPDPETVAAFQRADLILLNGADYANWVARASLPASRLVDTSEAFADRFLPVEEAVTHTHGPEGEHAHGGTASTTWLDPTLAVAQARAIADALQAARPGAASELERRMGELEAELLDLDSRLQAAAERIGDEPLLFSHPVYQYLTRRYGLNARSLLWEPDQEVDRRGWQELDHLRGEHPAAWVLWEEAPLGSVAAALEERGLRSRVFAPGANAPAEGDYLSAMGRNVAVLEEVGRSSRSVPGAHVP